MGRDVYMVKSASDMGWAVVDKLPNRVGYKGVVEDPSTREYHW